MTSHPSSAATINVTSSTPCSAPATPTTDNVTEWHAHYARWISRFWKRIRQEANDLNIIPKTYRGHVHARTISSTDVSNPVVALCHYLASPSLPSNVEAHQHVSAQFNHGVADWAYVELALADRAAADAGGATEVVLRAWLQGPDQGVRKAKSEVRRDHGCVVPPVPGYWTALPGVRVVGVPDAVEFREMEEELEQWEDEQAWRDGEEERKAERKRDREVVEEMLRLEGEKTWEQRTASEESQREEKLRQSRADRDMKKQEQRDWYAEGSKRRREWEELQNKETGDEELETENVRKVPDSDEEKTADTKVFIKVSDSEEEEQSVVGDIPQPKMPYY